MVSRQGPLKSVQDAKQSAAKQELEISQVPADMTADETKSWVDGDSSRARAALAAEQKRDEPRSTVISALERLAADETGAGAATGEA